MFGTYCSYIIRLIISLIPIVGFGVINYDKLNKSLQVNNISIDMVLTLFAALSTFINFFVLLGYMQK